MVGITRNRHANIRVVFQHLGNLVQFFVFAVFDIIAVEIEIHDREEPVGQAFLYRQFEVSQFGIDDTVYVRFGDGLRHLRYAVGINRIARRRIRFFIFVVHHLIHIAVQRYAFSVYTGTGGAFFFLVDHVDDAVAVGIGRVVHGNRGR